MFPTSLPPTPAIITNKEKISYPAFFHQVNRFATLIEPKCTKVAIWAENTPNWIYAFFAAWHQGATVVPIDFMSSAEDAAYILNDCKPELIFIGEEVLTNWEKAKELVSYPIDSLQLSKIAFTENEQSTINIPQDKDQTALIIYTSGTTGSPKGVMLSFGNLIANVTAVSEGSPIYTAQRQTLMLLPLHHIFPLLGSMVAPLWTGGTIVMAPSMQASDLRETMANNTIEIMIGVPRLYEMLHKGIEDKINASTAGRMLLKLVKKTKSRKLGKKVFGKVHRSMGGKLQFMVAGGAKLNTETGTFFHLLGFDVLEGFGMTEAAPMITFPRPGTQKIGTVGQALHGSEVMIKDGEVIAKGPQIMQGYYNRPEETAQILKDGWLYTGDYGAIDKDGFLTITGRKKEIIVLPNGKNINPVEIEQKLELENEIEELAVLMHQDMLHAIIVPNYAYFKSAGIDDFETYFKTNTLSAYNESQTPYKRITNFTVISSEIPRTRLGKIQRFKLEELTHKQEEETTTQNDALTPEFVTIKEHLESQITKKVLPHHHIEFDLNLDSLSKLGLIDFLDKAFGVSISEKELQNFASAGAIAEFVATNKTKHSHEATDWRASLGKKLHINLPKSWITLPIIRGFAKLYFKLYFKYKSSGIANLPDGPCIIAPNHQSFFDGLFVASALRSKVMRQTYFYAKKKHVKNPFVAFMANKNNVIVMDLQKDLHLSIQKMAEVLKRGKKLIIFPEGTRSHTGEVGDFKKTFAILSKELNVPVIPVAIDGAFKALPRGQFIPRLFTSIHVNMLSPIYPKELSIDNIVSQVKEAIEKKVNK